MSAQSGVMLGFQPTDSLRLKTRTDIKLACSPNTPRPMQAILTCTYYITFTDDGTPQVVDNVKFRVGDTNDMPAGWWYHKYKLTHEYMGQPDLSMLLSFAEIPLDNPVLCAPLPNPVPPMTEEEGPDDTTTAPDDAR